MIIGAGIPFSLHYLPTPLNVLVGLLALPLSSWQHFLEESWFMPLRDAGCNESSFRPGQIQRP